MQSKITVGFLLAACSVASCLAGCELEVDGSAESYFCENIEDLLALSTVAATAQRITIQNSNLPSLPATGFTKFAGSLVYLNVSNCKVAELKAGAFTGMTALQELILDNNQIKSIDSTWITGLTALKTLRVWNNEITHIEPAVFDQLLNLEVLDIAYNKFDKCLPATSLAKLAKLKTIYVAGNPWPSSCPTPLITPVVGHNVEIITDSGDSEILEKECLAHELHAKYNKDILDKCVEKLAKSAQIIPLQAVA